MGGEAPAAERRLPPSPAGKGSRRGERGEGRLRWFITGALCAAFLGLVRAGLETQEASLLHLDLVFVSLVLLLGRAPGFFLALRSEIAPGRLGNQYGMLGLEPVSVRPWSAV